MNTHKDNNQLMDRICVHIIQSMEMSADERRYQAIYGTSDPFQGVEPVKEMLTVQKAYDYLDNNISMNRKISDDRVKTYTQDLLEGRWTPEWKPLVFDRNGNLIDGQHRCWAVISANVAVPVMVVRGADPKVFDVIDRLGKNRTFRDVLNTRQFKHTTNLGTAIRTIAAYRSGDFLRRQTLSQTYLLEMIEKEPEIEVCSTRANSSTQIRKITSVGTFAGFYYLFRQINAKLADELLEGMDKGFADLDRPFNILRNQLMTMSKQMEAQYRRAKQVSYIISAWNAEMTGKKIKQLRHKQGELPKIVGYKG